MRFSIPRLGNVTPATYLSPFRLCVPGLRSVFSLPLSDECMNPSLSRDIMSALTLAAAFSCRLSSSRTHSLTWRSFVQAVRLIRHSYTPWCPQSLWWWDIWRRVSQHVPTAPHRPHTYPEPAFVGRLYLYVGRRTGGCRIVSVRRLKSDHSSPTQMSA